MMRSMEGWDRAWSDDVGENLTVDQGNVTGQREVLFQSIISKSQNAYIWQDLFTSKAICRVE